MEENLPPDQNVNQSSSLPATETTDPVSDFSPDFLLESLVEMMNQNPGAVLSITLHVPGGVVMGSLIGGKEYYDTMADMVRPTSGNGGSSLADYFADTGNKVYGPSKENNLQKTPPSYLHLKDAKLVAGNSVIPTEGGFLWRGRISTVSGFALGKLSK